MWPNRDLVDQQIVPCRHAAQAAGRHALIAKTIVWWGLLSAGAVVLAGAETPRPSGLESLSPLPEEPAPGAREDWLIVPGARKSGVYRGARPQEIVMTNGLIRRTWRLAPNAATVGFDNLTSGEALLRGVKPEARLLLDGKEYAIGGLNGQPDYAYLRPE